MSNERFQFDRPFSRDQLIFVVESILTAAFDRIESGLPTCITWEDRVDYVDGDEKRAMTLTSQDHTVLDTAGMALAILYAQTTGDGLGTYDALSAAKNFHLACQQCVEECWKDKGVNVEKRQKEMVGRTYSEIIPFHPDIRQHAVAFVDNCYNDSEVDFKDADQISIRENQYITVVLPDGQKISMGVGRLEDEQLPELDIRFPQDFNVNCFKEGLVPAAVNTRFGNCLVSRQLIIPLEKIGSEGEEDRYWIDENPVVKPFGKNTVGIVDEDTGGVFTYLGSRKLAEDYLRFLNGQS